ncbi:hypothetical protein ACFLRM_06725, partial [Acidobacteriota bacterium]
KVIQKEYNEAKSLAAKEEETSSFSLSAGQLPNIRDFTGDSVSKEVDVKIKEEGGEKTYRFFLRVYTLRDEAANLTRRGRWIIVKIESVS